MTAIGPLADHVRMLLAGTGIDPTEAVAVASGQVPAHGAAAHALAQGWAAAGHHRVEPPHAAWATDPEKGELA